MGGEIGQRHEWDANAELQWWLLGAGPYHHGLQRFVEDTNKLYRAEPGLWQCDYDFDGFFWVDCSDHEQSVLSFVRRNQDQSSVLLIVLNLTPILRENYRIGLPLGGYWREALNSDAEIYGGANRGNLGGVHAEQWPMHNQPYSAALRCPPLSILAFKHEA
jgi:1,4-alpha-glucan branching enzyme